MSDRPRSPRKTKRQPNRAQRKAQQVRMAETNAPAPLDMAVAMEQEQLVEVTASTPVQASRRASRRPAAQQINYVLPRDLEYTYIRADLRRLILTAAVLLAFMFVLLFILD